MTFPSDRRPSKRAVRQAMDAFRPLASQSGLTDAHSECRLSGMESIDGRGGMNEHLPKRNMATLAVAAALMEVIEGDLRLNADARSGRDNLDIGVAMGHCEAAREAIFQAVNNLAHMADHESAADILARWREEIAASKELFKPTERKHHA